MASWQIFAQFSTRWEWRVHICVNFSDTETDKNEWEDKVSRERDFTKYHWFPFYQRAPVFLVFQARHLLGVRDRWSQNFGLIIWNFGGKTQPLPRSVWNSRFDTSPSHRFLICLFLRTQFLGSVLQVNWLVSVCYKNVPIASSHGTSGRSTVWIARNCDSLSVCLSVAQTHSTKDVVLGIY